MVNTIIQGLWIGGSLSVMEQISINSFLRNGHEYHLYVFDEVKGVPPGAIVKDGEEIVSRSLVFGDKDIHASYSNFSDVFRYKLLLDRGGFWADTDLVCLRPFDFQSEYVFGGEKIQEGTEDEVKYGSAWVNGCAMMAPPGSSIMEYCYDLSLKRIPVTTMAWELGPPILTEAVPEFQLQSYIMPYYTFNPVHWWEWNSVIDGELERSLRIQERLIKTQPHAMHLWNTMWNREPANKNANYPENCLYEKFKKRYLSDTLK